MLLGGGGILDSFGSVRAAIQHYPVSGVGLLIFVLRFHLVGFGRFL